MTIASNNISLFDPEVRYLNMFEHKITSYRFAVPLRYISPVERSNWRFKRRMKQAITQIRFRTFSTLSYADSFLPAESVHVKKMMNRLKVQEKRNGNTQISYIWRIDYGRNTFRPHYHLLLSCTVDHKQLAKYWEKGFVWIEYLQSQQEALKYVIRYMSKSETRRETVKRRYGCSRDIPKTPPPEYKKAVLIEESEYHEKVELHNESLKRLVDNTNTP